MIYLIEYQKGPGRLMTFKEFDEESRVLARDERLALELDLNRRGVVDHEVVLLEAANKDALLRTHRRYFQTFRQIVDAGTETI